MNKALFALYRQFRDVLVLSAYSIPFTEELAINMGDLDTSSLWRSLGNPDSALPPYQYPVEELALLPRYQPGNNQTAYIGSTYKPYLLPNRVTGVTVEQPPVQWVAPYQAQSSGEFTTPTTPDDFIDTPLGPDDMFSTAGLRTPTSTGVKSNSFADSPRNFGGALANCQRAIALAEAGFPNQTTLPDYTLDGDRGYAWPCWDVACTVLVPEVQNLNPPWNPPNCKTEFINPIDVSNNNPAHVDAVLPPDEG